MTPRTYLFVPADRPERFAKALASGAGAVIFDLEDAVAPAAKPQAREQLAQWLRREGAGTAPAALHVRCNAPSTPWFADDLAMLAKLAPVSPGAADGRVVGLMLPKAEDAAQVAAAHRASGGRPVLPLVETALGIDRVRAIAEAPGVQRLAFGSIDLQLDLGITEGPEGVASPELLWFRSRLVLASRLAGLAAPVDGVTTSIDDPEVIERDARAARRLGFGAKLCIHPRQLAAARTAFAPGEAEVAWARRVLQAIEQAGGGAAVVDGKMVNRPVELRAREVLEAAAVR